MSLVLGLLVAVCLAAWLRRTRKRRSREHPAQAVVVTAAEHQPGPKITRRGLLGPGHGGRM